MEQHSGLCTKNTRVDTVVFGAGGGIRGCKGEDTKVKKVKDAMPVNGQRGFRGEDETGRIMRIVDAFEDNKLRTAGILQVCQIWYCKLRFIGNPDNTLIELCIYTLISIDTIIGHSKAC